jgi:hypothetical protein
LNSYYKMIGPLTTHLVAYSTTEMFAWLTEWFYCEGVDSVRAAIRVMRVQGGAGQSFQARLAIQTAAVRTDAEDVGIGLGTNISAGVGVALGSAVFDQSVVTYTGGGTGGGLFIRIGVAYSLAAAGNPVGADVALDCAFDVLGEVVGASTFQLATTSGTMIALPVTPWLPANAVAKVKFAFILTGLTTGTLQLYGKQRTATVTTDSPNNWGNLVGSPGTPYTGAQELDTGDVASGLATSVYFVQYGIGYSSSVGGTLAEGTVTAIYAVRS